jgi:hypothetical protein
MECYELKQKTIVELRRKQKSACCIKKGSGIVATTSIQSDKLINERKTYGIPFLPSFSA